MYKLVNLSLITATTLFIGCGGGANSSSTSPQIRTDETNITLYSDGNLSTIENNLSTQNGNIGVKFKTPFAYNIGVEQNVCSDTSLLSPTISDDAIYVSTAGDDTTGDGSSSNPYKSVAKAVSMLKEGGTVVIHGGTYVEPNEIRVRVPNVTITSYPNEWAVLDRTSSGGADDWDSGIYLDVDSDGSTIRCLEVKGGFYALSTETKWDWNESDKMGATNITVTNVKLHESYADAVKIKPNCDDFNISYSEIYNTGIGQNPNDCNAEGIDNVNADRTTASHLHIYNTCSTGIYFKGGSIGSVVEYSFIHDTSEAGILLGFDTSPEFFDKTVNPDMYEAIDAKAHHNLVKNTKYSGIGLYASKNSRVHHNTLINTNYSNQHGMLYLGITYQDWDKDALRPSNISPYIHNNILYENGDHIYGYTPPENDLTMVAIRQSDEEQLGELSALDGGMDIDYNCYYISSSIDFSDQRDDWRGDLSAWQTHINGDTHSKESDPKFDVNSVAQSLECRYMGYAQK